MRPPSCTHARFIPDCVVESLCTTLDMGAGLVQQQQHKTKLCRAVDTTDRAAALHCHQASAEFTKFEFTKFGFTKSWSQKHAGLKQPSQGRPTDEGLWSKVTPVMTALNATFHAAMHSVVHQESRACTPPAVSAAPLLCGPQPSQGRCAGNALCPRSVSMSVSGRLCPHPLKLQLLVVCLPQAIGCQLPPACLLLTWAVHLCQAVPLSAGYYCVKPRCQSHRH